MPYFSDHEARSIIRDAYMQVHSDGAAVAEAFYAPDELAASLARLFRSRSELVIPCAMRHSIRASRCWISAAAQASTRSSPHAPWDRQVTWLAST